MVNTRTYAGRLSLEVHRPVELLIGYDSELCSQTFFGGPSAGQSTPPTCKRVFTTATVWSEAFTLLGPRGGAASHVKESLGELLDTFLAEYFRANP